MAQAGRRYTLREQDDLNAKYIALSRKVEAIELAKVSIVSVPSEPIRELICVVCDSHHHDTADCPSIPALREVV